MKKALHKEATYTLSVYNHATSSFETVEVAVSFELS